MLDVTDLPSVELGDEVVIFGYQNGNEISVDEIAQRCKTINYEILTSLSSRIPRCYK
jgi:alanine racemase